MKIIYTLLKASLPIFLISIGASVLSGGAFSGMIGLIHTGMKTGMRNPGEIVPWFFLFWGGYGIFSVLASYTITRLSQKVIFDLRDRISRKILRASFKKIEDRKSEMLTVLTQDIATIASSITRMPSVLTGATTVLGGFIYLGITSPRLFLLLLAVLLFAMFFFVFPLRYFHKRMEKVRGIWGILYHQFGGLTNGLKELLLNRRLRDTFVGEVLLSSSREQMNETVKGEVWNSFFSRMGDMVLLLGLGILLFSVNSFAWTNFTEISQFLMITVLLLNPLSTTVGYLPVISKMSVSMAEIEKIGLQLSEAAREESDTLRPIPVRNRKPLVKWEGVTHTYFHEQQDKFFRLGPVDLQLEEGETVFLVGGNGSGKTTLAKLLCGLYPPESGTISYCGTPVTAEYAESYRELYSALFTDYYLFDGLQYLDERQVAEKGEHYLKLLEIDHKVSLADMKISNIRLSEGQKKRLILLRAFLEDKPLYIFDEWAAGQDPYYKKIFYHNIIPDLKKAGKTVFAITHDEQYFNTADRVLILRDGQLVQDGVWYG